MSAAPNIDSPFLTLDEATTFLRLPRSETLRAAAARGEVPDAAKHGRRWMFTRAGLLAYHRWLAAGPKELPCPSIAGKARLAGTSESAATSTVLRELRTARRRSP